MVDAEHALMVLADTMERFVQLGNQVQAYIQGIGMEQATGPLLLLPPSGELGVLYGVHHLHLVLHPQ